MPGKKDKIDACCFTDRVKRCFRRGQCNSLLGPLSRRCDAGRIKICKITGDRKVCGRMAAMGVYPGVEADIISSGYGNRCILKVNGGTVSLDADVSENILVTSL